MLFNGEEVGDGDGPEVDVAVDPLEGTRLTALGIPGAISVIAVAERGSMFFPGAAVYMDKIAVGPEAADAIDIDALADRERRSASPRRRASTPNDLTVVVLERDRHDELIAELRASGARVQPDPRRRRGARRSPPRSTFTGHRRADGHRRDAGGRHLRRRDQVPRRRAPGPAVAALRRGARRARRRRLRRRRGPHARRPRLAATTSSSPRPASPSGALLRGVRTSAAGVETESIVMRSRSGTVRRIAAYHPSEKIRQLRREGER